MPAGSLEQDTALDRAFASGSQAALAEAYRRFASLIRSLVLRRLTDPAAADDVVQEVFIRAWKYSSGPGNTGEAMSQSCPGSCPLGRYPLVDISDAPYDGDPAHSGALRGLNPARSVAALVDVVI